MFAVQPVTDVEMAFGGAIERLIPEEVPQHYPDRSKWSAFVSQTFSKGLEGVTLLPKAGVDASLAVRHLRTVMGSFHLRHFRKMRICAYLCSEWFTGWEGTPTPPPAPVPEEERVYSMIRFVRDV
jgi:hypothetical protein